MFIVQIVQGTCSACAEVDVPIGDSTIVVAERDATVVDWLRGWSWRMILVT